MAETIEITQLQNGTGCLYIAETLYERIFYMCREPQNSILLLYILYFIIICVKQCGFCILFYYFYVYGSSATACGI